MDRNDPKTIPIIFLRARFRSATWGAGPGNRVRKPFGVGKKRKSAMRLSVVAACVLIGAASLMSGSLARAASDCSISGTLADWGESSTGYIDMKSGGSCQFPIRIRGTVNSSDISQKPQHGKLKRLNISTFEYRAKAGFKGSDAFAIKATGQGPTAAGTSVITVHATMK
jgi:hypothetical protein